MNYRLYIYLLLSFAVVIAGCISGGKTKTEVISKDMLVIKSIDVFPSKTVQPQDTIVVRMEVENGGQDAAYLLVDADNDGKDKTATSWNGDYLLIDHCNTLYRDSANSDSKFQILSGGRCIEIYGADDKETPLIPLVKDSNGEPIGAGCYLKFSPQQSHTFQWTMKAPSENSIAKMTHKCQFKFQTAYAAQASTNTWVYFATPLEVAQRLYTNKEMGLAGDNVASYGPVAVNFAPAEPQPISAKKGGTWTVFLKLMNVGTGIADVSALKLHLPENGANEGAIKTSVVDGVDQCMFDAKLSIKDIDKQLEPFNIISRVILEISSVTVEDLFDYYFRACNLDKDNSACSDENKAVIENYGTFNKDNIFVCKSDYTGFCSMTYPTIKTDLESLKSKLQIYSKASSSIPCELTIPASVTILSPFKFTTIADYTYKIRQDVEITTKPIKESA